MSSRRSLGDDDPPPDRAGARRALATVGSTLRGLPAVGLALAGVAVAVVVRSTDGRYVGDNRFDQYWAPGWRLARETSLWDGTRGLGRVGEELWPLTLPLALLRALGLSPILTQQLWHITVLTLSGLGVAVLLRTVAPRVGLTHLVAALVYTYSPYGLIFLVPTNLYWAFVLAPWLLAVAIHGLRSPHPWRWAAVWALLVATGGDTDLPGLILAALWTLPAAVFLVAIERSVSAGHAARWIAAAGGLAVWVSAAVLVKVRLGSGPLAQRLLTTEGVAEVNLTSSWSESWRGLGYWVTYYGAPGRSGDVPGASAWFETLPGVLATFIVPVVALVGLRQLRWRLRLLWGGLIVLSLVIMVGSSPSPARSPLGGALLAAYDLVPSLASFRTTYKAGSGLMVGVAILAASACAAWGTALARRDPRLRSVPLALLAVAVLATAVPAWSGRLYPEDRQTDAIAAHWIEAARWIEAQPGDARVLVLPGSTQTAYRWGWVGDDILDSLLRRHPNVTPTNFPVSTPLTADLIDAIARRIDEERLTAGELATVARRLGIGWIVLRNDLDWERIRVPRPLTLDPLRDSDELPLAARFGAPGQDTTASDDTSAAARREAELAPIEVLEVPGATRGRDLTRSGAPPLLIDGGGDAWVQLAGLGLLDGDRALRFAATASPADVTASLAAGSPLIVTDTNRRQLTLIRGPGPTSSELLTPDGDPGPVPPADLFGVEGSQTTAAFGDATRIEASDFGEDLGGFSPWFRPALAFDRDLQTSWRTGPQRDPVGDSITLTLAEPVPVEVITLVPIRAAGGQRRVSGVELDVGGTVVSADVPGEGRVPVPVPGAGSVDRITVTITEVEGGGDGPVGFSEIEVPEVDARERVVLPDHLTASDDPALSAALADVPLAYVLTRSGRFRTVRGSRHDEERLLRRVLHVPSDRSFSLSATVAGGRDLSDEAVDALIGGEVGAWGTSRPVSPGEGRGGLALDGDPTTGWVGVAQAGERLTVRLAPQDVSAVRVRLGGSADDVPLRELRVVIAGRPDATINLVPEDCADAPCDLVGQLEIGGPAIAELALEVPTTVAGSRRVRVLEVEVEGADGVVRPEPLAGGECGRGVLEIDGTAAPMRLADGLDLSALDAPQVAVEACAPVELDEGDHEVATLAGTRIEQVVLATAGALEVPDPSPLTGRAQAAGPGRLEVAVDGEEGGWALTGQSFDAGWEAALDGEDLGPAREVDGQSAWIIPAGESRSVAMRFGPQRVYRAALVVSALGVAACAALIIGPRRRRAEAEVEADYGHPRATPEKRGPEAS